MPPILTPSLLKFQELKELIRENSINKKKFAVEFSTTLVLMEAKQKYQNKCIIDQVEEAKKLFLTNPNKYLAKKFIDISI
jgi:hypothetical protein